MHFGHERTENVPLGISLEDISSTADGCPETPDWIPDVKPIGEDQHLKLSYAAFLPSSFLLFSTFYSTFGMKHSSTVNLASEQMNGPM